MNGFEDELGRAAGPPEPPLDLGVLEARARRRAKAKRRALASGACAVVLLASGVAWGATRGDGPAHQVAAGEVGDGSTTTEATEGTLYPTTTTSAVETTTTAPEPATTTTTTTTEAATTTTTAVPDGAGTIEVRGTYTGTETYRTDATECAREGGNIAHNLIARFSPTQVNGGDGDLAPGDWDAKFDYCSQISGAHWSATGSFALAFPGHESLFGVFESETAYPTDGEPYRLTIDEGTDQFTGATGTCDLTVRISDKALGSQTQSGEFTCTWTSTG